MSDYSRDICALWIVHSYLIKRFMISPKLSIRSAVKGCGKSTLLDVLSHLVFRALVTGSITRAALFRIIDMWHPTLLIDEVDSFVGDDEELRGMLNNSHRYDGAVVRTVGDEHEPRRFSIYAAVALAGIGGLVDTLADRSVTNDLQRRRPSEPIAQLRIGRMEHLHTMRRRIARWVTDHEERIAARDPKMPAGIYNREADNWHVLLAVADEAGGEWPERARKAAEQAHIAGAGDDASWLELLLGDIRTIRKGKTEMPSADLVKALVALEGRPWAEMGKTGKPLTQNKLARMLKPLGIAPQNIRVGDKVAKGYAFRHFEDAFSRYLPDEGASEPLHRYNADKTGTSDIFQTATSEADVADGKCEKSANDGPCSGVAVAPGGSGEKTHVRTAKAKSDDLPYTGPVVELPGQGPDGLDVHGAPQAPQDQGPPGASASVPFMMTQETKRRLRICGYSDAQIAGMTPQAALDILGPWAPQPTNGGEPGLSSRRIQALADWYADKAYYQYSASEAGNLDAEFRAILREEVSPELVEIELQRVKKAVWRGH